MADDKFPVAVAILSLGAVVGGVSATLGDDQMKNTVQTFQYEVRQVLRTVEPFRPDQIFVESPVGSGEYVSLDMHLSEIPNKYHERDIEETEIKELVGW